MSVDYVILSGVRTEGVHNLSLDARDRIKLQRPFERQEDYLRRHGIYM